jgi:hypothetical protein
MLVSLLMHMQQFTYTFSPRLQEVVTASLPSEAELRAMGNGDLKRLATSRFAHKTSSFVEFFCIL